MTALLFSFFKKFSKNREEEYYFCDILVYCAILSMIII